MTEIITASFYDSLLHEINGLLENLPTASAIKYPRLNVSSDEIENSDENLLVISETLIGWKKMYF